MNLIQPDNGDIFYFDLDPTKGREMKKARPCVIVADPSTQSAEKSPSGIVVIIPLTSSQKNFWTEIPVRKKGKMTRDSYALCHQIRALDKSRATTKVAKADTREMKRIKQVLRIMFEI